MKYKPKRLVLAGLLVVLGPWFIFEAKIKKIKARDNPTEYLAFSRRFQKRTAGIMLWTG